MQLRAVVLVGMMVGLLAPISKARAQTAVTVDARAVVASGNAQVLVNVASAGTGTSVYFWSTSVTSLSLADGTYTVGQAGAPAYGSFNLAGGTITAASGAITASGLVVTVDTTQLSRVPVATSALSNPAGLVTIVIGGAVLWAGDATFFFADGAYAITGYSGVGNYGAFTVSGGAIASVTSPAIAGGGGIAFDLSRLASVHVPASALSIPAGASTVRVSTNPGAGTAVIWSGDATLYLADATYSISDYGVAAVYGGFTVSRGLVGSPTGAVTVAADGIAFDLTRLARVDFAFGAFSSPANNQVVRIDTGGSGIAVFPSGNGTLFLPDGAYAVTNYDLSVTYASFTVAQRSISAASGACTAQGGALACDPCAITHVRITLPNGSNGQVRYTTNNFSGTLVAALPAGSYIIDSGLGTFTIDASGNVTTSGAATVTTASYADSGGQCLPSAVSNGGFENGSSGWILQGSTAVVTSGGTPHSGTSYARLGGVNNAWGGIGQQITIPAGVTSVTLSYWLEISTTETTTTQRNDVLSVGLATPQGAPIHLFVQHSNLDASAFAVYRQETFSLLPWAGQTLDVVFAVNSNATLPTTFNVDDISVTYQ